VVVDASLHFGTQHCRNISLHEEEAEQWLLFTVAKEKSMGIQWRIAL